MTEQLVLPLRGTISEPHEKVAGAFIFQPKDASNVGDGWYHWCDFKGTLHETPAWVHSEMTRIGFLGKGLSRWAHWRADLFCLGCDEQSEFHTLDWDPDDDEWALSTLSKIGG